MKMIGSISEIINELRIQRAEPLEICEFLISMTNNFEEVRLLIKDLFKLGIKPNKRIFKFMLILSESYENAGYTINLMKKYNIIPDSWDCLRWISFADNEEQASSVIEEMKLLKIELTPAIYGDLMKVQDSFSKAKKIFDELKMFQPILSHLFYYTLINKAETTEQYNEVLSEMANAGITYDNDIKNKMTQSNIYRIIIEGALEYKNAIRNQYESRFPHVVDMVESNKCNCIENPVDDETTAELDYINYDDDSLQFPEGKKAYRLHRVIERNPTVIKLAKERFVQNHNGKLFCEVCGIEFKLIYGDRGDGFIEGHHKKLVSDMKEGEMTKVEDITMLCSNCHRMIHRPPLITVEQLACIVNCSKKIEE